MKMILLGLICLSGSVLPAEEITCGDVFRISARSANEQRRPIAAPLPDGGAVICYGGNWLDGSNEGVFARLFESGGIRLGEEFGVNSWTQGNQWLNGVTPFPDGRFVIYWRNSGSEGPSEIAAQMFARDGNRLGTEFSVNSHDDGNQVQPRIASLSSGGFVACWQSWSQDSSWDIYGQIFSPDGEKIGREFRVNTYTQNVQQYGIIQSLPSGNFIVSWISMDQDGSGNGVYGQLFSPAGEKLGDEFRVNSYTENDQDSHSIAPLPDGGFIVCWASSGQDGTHQGIYGQLFTPDAVRRGQEFRVNPKTDNWYWSTRLTALPGGNVVACWNGMISFWEQSGVNGQVLSLDGQKIGSPFHLYTETENGQGIPSVAARPDGGFAVVWANQTRNGNTGGVYGQLFTPTGSKINGTFRINSNADTSQMNPVIVSFPDSGFLVCWERENPDIWGYEILGKRFPSYASIHPLHPFDLVEPADDFSSRKTDVILRWRRPIEQKIYYSNELRFEVWLGYDPDLKYPLIYEQDEDTTLTLHGLWPGSTYFWKVKAMNLAGDSLWSSTTNGFFIRYDTVGVGEARTPGPEVSTLHPGFPNPFNSSTSFRFETAWTGRVQITVIDPVGRLIRVLLDESRIAGEYSVRWDGCDASDNPVPSGIYICRMEVLSGGGKRFVRSIKMGLVR
jgi:hypothetical protein